VSELDRLYCDTKTQAIEKGIVNFKGDKHQWKKEKRKLRRRDKKRLYNVSKNIF
jgi:hypothetical protein